MLRAVLFELEGVLIDSHDLRRHALRQALAADDVRVTTAEFDERYAGVPTRTATAHALSAAGRDPDETAIDLATLRAERAFLGMLANGFALSDGARDLLDALAPRARLGIVTRATRQEADTLLTAAGLDVVFELVVTADDVPAPKPSPASHLHALSVMSRRRPVEAAHALALEDGWVGITAAAAAGLRCIATGRLAAYQAVQANALVPSLRGHTLDTLERLAAHPREHIA